MDFVSGILLCAYLFLLSGIWNFTAYERRREKAEFDKATATIVMVEPPRAPTLLLDSDSLRMLDEQEQKEAEQEAMSDLAANLEARISSLLESESDEYYSASSRSLVIGSSPQASVSPSPSMSAAALYNEWLKGCRAQGGKVTHVYDYNVPTRFRVAREGERITAAYGAHSSYIVVPAGVQIDVQSLGHNRVFYMDGFRPAEDWWIPSYRDANGRS